jgi:hypothetical protein
MKFSEEILPGVRMEYGPDVWKRGHDITFVLVNELKRQNQVTESGGKEQTNSRDPNG